MEVHCGVFHCFAWLWIGMEVVRRLRSQNRVWQSLLPCCCQFASQERSWRVYNVYNVLHIITLHHIEAYTVHIMYYTSLHHITLKPHASCNCRGASYRKTIKNTCEHNNFTFRVNLGGQGGSFCTSSLWYFVKDLLLDCNLDGPGIYWLKFLNQRNDSGDILKSELSSGPGVSVLACWWWSRPSWSWFWCWLCAG